MKIQCSCGAKYALDISPEMAQTPVRFVCPACGVDASDFVNNLVRQELGLSEPAVAPPPEFSLTSEPKLTPRQVLRLFEAALPEVHGAFRLRLFAAVQEQGPDAGH